MLSTQQLQLKRPVAIENGQKAQLQLALSQFALSQPYHNSLITIALLPYHNSLITICLITALSQLPYHNCLITGWICSRASAPPDHADLLLTREDRTQQRDWVSNLFSKLLSVQGTRS
jgi:hypothetical protein